MGRRGHSPSRGPGDGDPGDVLRTALVQYCDSAICRLTEPAASRLHYVLVQPTVDDHRERMAGGFPERIAQLIAVGQEGGPDHGLASYPLRRLLHDSGADSQPYPDPAVLRKGSVYPFEFLAQLTKVVHEEGKLAGLRRPCGNAAVARMLDERLLPVKSGVACSPVLDLCHPVLQFPLLVILTRAVPLGVGHGDNATYWSNAGPSDHDFLLRARAVHADRMALPAPERQNGCQMTPSGWVPTPQHGVQPYPGRGDAALRHANTWPQNRRRVSTCLPYQEYSRIRVHGVIHVTGGFISQPPRSRTRENTQGLIIFGRSSGVGLFPDELARCEAAERADNLRARPRQPHGLTLFRNRQRRASRPPSSVRISTRLEFLVG